MTMAIAIIILIAGGFLYYGWIRLQQEATAKITQLIFRKTHREGEGAVGRTHLITPKSVSAHALLEAAWEAIDVPASEKAPLWWPASIFKWRSDDPTGLDFPIEGPPDLHAVVCNAAHRQRRHAAPVERRPSIAVQRSGARGQEPSQSGTARHQGDEGM